MHRFVEQVVDKIHKYRNDHYATSDDIVVFTPPKVREEVNWESDLNWKDPTSDETEIAGLSVIWDNGVDEPTILPPLIHDLHPDESFFECPPDDYLTQLLEAYWPWEYLDENDVPMAEVRIPFELLEERYIINESVKEERERYTTVPMEEVIEYEPGGGQIYHAKIGFRGSSATYKDAATDILKDGIRDAINSTVTEPIYGTKHYTIRTMTGNEIHRTERVQIGKREYQLGRVYCTPISGRRNR